jgi:hypothetical protein
MMEISRGLGDLLKQGIEEEMKLFI